MRAEQRAGAEPGLRAGGGWVGSGQPQVHLVTGSSLPRHVRADLAAPSLGATTSEQGQGCGPPREPADGKGTWVASPFSEKRGSKILF